MHTHMHTHPHSKLVSSLIYFGCSSSLTDLVESAVQAIQLAGIGEVAPHQICQLQPLFLPPFPAQPLRSAADQRLHTIWHPTIESCHVLFCSVLSCAGLGSWCYVPPDLPAADVLSPCAPCTASQTSINCSWAHSMATLVLGLVLLCSKSLTFRPNKSANC